MDPGPDPKSPRSSSKAPRRIACSRCRSRKKRCDHAVPTCGECRKSGSECLQYGARKSGSFATVPIAYLRQLETQVAASRDSPKTCEPLTPGLDGFDGGVVEEEGGPFGEDEYPPSLGSSAENQYPVSNSGDVRFVTETDQARLEERSATSSNFPPRERYQQTARASPHAVAHPEAMLNIGEDWLDHYASIYFQHVQPQWSFVDKQLWRTAYQERKGRRLTTPPAHEFILQMVLAVGALVSSSFRSDCPHLAHASRLHDEAMRNNLVHVTGHPSALIRTQSYLLVLLHALHGPSPDPVPASMLLVLMNCANIMNETRGSFRHDEDLFEDFEHTKKLTIMSSHILNEVVASAWTYPQPSMFDILDEAVRFFLAPAVGITAANMFQIYKHASQMPLGLKEIGFYGHVFRLRCIQSRIRHFNKMLQKLDPADPFRETCRERLKEELQVWKERVETVTNSSPKDDLVYHKPVSLSKLYDYSLSILMQERPCMMGNADVDQLLESCSEACRTFFSSQEADSVIYWTWTALMYQFRLGIIILYCYAMTPPILRNSSFTLPETISGLDCCKKTLQKFSTRWPRARVFLDTYRLLAEAVFDGPAFDQTCDSNVLESPSSQSLCSSYALEGERKIKIQEDLAELRINHVHQAVISLIEEMVNRSHPQTLNLEGLDFIPNISMAGFDLFNF